MSTEDKYARSIAKLVVGQLMAADGLDSAQRSTIDILSDLLVRYIVEIGSQSHMYAELSHRTECSPTDMATALRNMGQTIPELLQYAKKLEDTTLAQNISDFPLSKALPTPASFASCGETPPSHIPSFLPAFPDPHTLMETAKFVHTEHTTHSRQQQVTEQQQQGEEALVNIEAREHPESAPLQSAKEKLGDSNENGAEEGNVFLAPVLWEASEPTTTKPVAAAGGGASGGTTAAPKGATAGDESMIDLNVEWLASEGTNAAPMPDLNFEGFQMTGTGNRVTLATSGRLQVPDAYGDDGTVPDLSIAPGARRRRLIGTSDATRNRVREILSTRAEDADMAYGTEDVFMDHEMI